LRLALVTAQRPADAKGEASVPPPQVGAAVGAALLLAVVATLILGIVPNEVLRAAEAGAHTLQGPAAPLQSFHPIVIETLQKP